MVLPIARQLSPSGHALKGLGLLVVGQLRFAAEPRAAFPGGDRI